ncbi:hypothetical protein BD779DRAFT_1471895 [Infundibulicybe gibba]|nr:hypothetical protein BD779DRAFT_1471895 [Infundibulicybe gibba]
MSIVTEIPTEVLEQIFVHSVNTAPPSVRARHLCDITATCQRWRGVAIALPELWSSIRTWLTRSKNHLLSLALIYNDEPQAFHGTPLPQSVTDFLDLFVLHIHRWKHLTLELRDLNPLVEFPLTLSDLSAPLLASVIIGSTFLSLLSSDRRLWLSSLINRAPVLKRLTVRGYGALTALTIPWSQLAYIRIEQALSDTEAITILALAKGLTEAQFANINTATLSMESSTVVVADHLSTLHLLPVVSLGRLFRRLVLPKLECLSISHGPKLPPWDQEEFKSLISRSFCSIKTFVLQPSPLTSSELLECLELISPSLIDLAIVVGKLVPGSNATEKVTSEIIHRLTNGSTSSVDVLCPHLKRITFERCLHPDLEDGLLSNMVESRWKQRWAI